MNLKQFKQVQTQAQDEYIAKMESLLSKHKEAEDAFCIWLGIAILLGMIIFDMSELPNLLMGILAIPVLYAFIQLIQYKSEISMTRETYFASNREQRN
ncbi:hypothetical protein Sps_03036 [Shewanella psychrophila]|uniref:Uncharacterized protein n=1 Tax=Shewanella psychrophila TaxID=225848 RepID=A0A1S6HRN5_9GAMM|nr:hypothetical protein [Shewanella psychrophila]AQS38183.1 hypothetical protein Sps_03036 [Shewanella psychrophila]